MGKERKIYYYKIDRPCGLCKNETRIKYVAKLDSDSPREAKQAALNEARRRHLEEYHKS